MVERNHLKKWGSEDVSRLIITQLNAFFDKSSSGVRLVDVIASLDMSFITDEVVHKHSFFSKIGLVKLYLAKRVYRIKKYSGLDHLSLTTIGLTKLPTKRCFNQFLLKIDKSLLNFIAEP